MARSTAASEKWRIDWTSGSNASTRYRLKADI
jgi:hypothetical protein